MKNIFVAFVLAGVAAAAAPGVASAQSTADGDFTVAATRLSGHYHDKKQCQTARDSAEHSGYTIVRECHPRSRYWYFAYQD